jgi:hypothetical protein
MNGEKQATISDNKYGKYKATVLTVVGFTE